MIVTIMQPAYLPWLGYFHRASLSDLFVVLDHVHIDKSSKTGFAHRNRVRRKEGWVWLTVPLKTKGRHGNLPLNLVRIDDEQNWRHKHWMTIRTSYAKAPYFADHAAMFEAFYARPWECLASLARETTAYQLGVLGLRPRVIYSSEMEVEGTGGELILEICRSTSATTYISGPFGREYLDFRRFADAGVGLVFHDYVHPVYPQVYPGFESYMAAIDVLFNCGPGSLDVIRSGNEAIEREVGARRRDAAAAP
jgi:hypothetical protein